MTYHLLTGLNFIAANQDEGLHPKLLDVLNAPRDFHSSTIDLQPHLTIACQQAHINFSLTQKTDHEYVTHVDFRKPSLKLATRQQ